MTIIISPLDIATDGLLSGKPITMATMGYVVILTEEIIEIHGAGIVPTRLRKKKKQKRVTATVTIDGIEYSAVAYTDNLELKLSEVHVVISNKLPNKIRLIL